VDESVYYPCYGTCNLCIIPVMEHMCKSVYVDESVYYAICVLCNLCIICIYESVYTCLKILCIIPV
jgi:hypothetical protein